MDLIQANFSIKLLVNEHVLTFWSSINYPIILSRVIVRESFNKSLENPRDGARSMETSLVY